jgi:alpha-glucosidase
MNIRQPHKIALTLTYGLLLYSIGMSRAAGAPSISARTDAAAVGWSSLGNMPVPVWDGKTLSSQNNQGTLAITPLSDDVIRVRFTTAKAFGRDHSYAVVSHDPGSPTVKIESCSNATTLVTAALRVTVQYAPLRISFANLAGDTLDADDSGRGTAFAGAGFRVAKQLRDDEHVYGFGEKTGTLDKRGWQLGGYHLTMWNSDTFSYDSSTDPVYVSVPFYMVVRHGEAYGLFLDNTWRTTFDVGRERQDLLTFGAEGGDLNYYFINGPDPKKVCERYTTLTGRIPLPPLWALGFNQCRYSYYPESKVRWIANTLREKQIPADVIWLDIHYQDGYKPFTWDPERFLDPKKMISDLRGQGFRVVTIVDAHPKVEKGYAPYDQGLAGNYFVKNPDGSVYEAPVWPSHAEKNPGPSVFPDFSKPDARAWWGSLYKGFLDIGVAGIWNDMNEPAVFDTPTGTMPLDEVFDNEGQPATHREIHNVYGQLMSRATFEGLSRLRPTERPFVLTRASFSGGQRYAAVWPGDNTSEWSSLRQSIPTLLGLGLSGFSFVGCDIGGFVGSPSGELYTRWLQVGVFYPFMRSHSNLGSPDKEPWSFGYQNEIINKHAIELRYELLPYIYNEMQQASQTGVPAMRPLFLNFPDDENVARMNDEFLFGDNLLVAPVLNQGATDRDVYLPKGNWYDFWTGHKFAGGQTIQQPVSIDSIPIFVRGGGFVFRQPIVQFTGEMPGKALRVLIAPSEESESSQYEDSGQSLDYRKGEFMKRRFHQHRDDRGMIVDVSGPEGSFRPAARELLIETWLEHEPHAVSVRLGDDAGNGNILPHLGPSSLESSPRGWSYTNGLITVKQSDDFGAMRFSIQN